jgi:hypothetical protein
MIAQDPRFDRPTGTNRRNAAGSAASRQRGEAEIVSGALSARKARILALLDDAGPMGMTWKEFRDLDPDGFAHQKVTSALSNLHQDDLIARLKGDLTRRNGCSVYIAPAHRHGRLVSAYRTNASKNTEAQRPRLTDDEREIVNRLRERAAATPRDQPVRWGLLHSTAEALLAAIDRLDA